MTELPSWKSGWDEEINTKFIIIFLGRIAKDEIAHALDKHLSNLNLFPDYKSIPCYW